MERCTHLLRLQYNWRLRERIEAYEQVSAPKLGSFCCLDSKSEAWPLTCSVSKSALYGDPWKFAKDGVGKKRSAFEMQCADLPNLKAERPWYASLPSQPLQQMLKQLDDAFQRFFKGLGGYPNPKRRGKLRSFTYPAGACKFQGSRVKLPGFGWMRFYQSRPFPSGFETRKVTVRRKAYGWYICVALQDETVPATLRPNEVKTAVGVDVGINKLASLSNGETIANPRFYASFERKRNRLNRAATRKQKGSKKRPKAYQRLARLDQKIVNKRSDYQWKIAHQLVSHFNLIVFENLNIKNMMKRCKPKQDEQGKYVENGQSRKAGLNKAIQDASWYSLKEKVKVLAARLGILVHEINPRHTSQQCSQCDYISPTNRNGEKFICENCNHHADADIDAAVVILRRGLDDLGIKLDAVPGVIREQGKSTPTEPAQKQGKSVQRAEPGNPHEVKFKTLKSIQLNLFEWMESQ